MDACELHEPLTPAAQIAWFRAAAVIEREMAAISRSGAVIADHLTTAESFERTAARLAADAAL